MFSPALVLFSLFAGSGLLGSVSGSSALEEVYKDVVSVVSPGQQLLTGDSLRSLFNTLEKRVQCGAVSCEKVSFRARWWTAGSCGKGVKVQQPLTRCTCCSTLIMHYALIFINLQVLN